MLSSLPKPRAYTPLAKLLHWAMALIWIAVWIMGYLAVTCRETLNEHHGLTTAHKALASTLLFLMVLRIVWRLTHPAPSLPDSMGAGVKAVAHVGHFLLYALAIFALPVSGWLWSSVADKPVRVLWLFELPPLVPPCPTYYDLMRDIHVTIAFTAGALVVGHFLVALKHALIDKDGVMGSMLPQIRRSAKR